MTPTLAVLIMILICTGLSYRYSYIGIVAVIGLTIYPENEQFVYIVGCVFAIAMIISGFREQ